jgi:hypothetical protein
VFINVSFTGNKAQSSNTSNGHGGALMFTANNANPQASTLINCVITGNEARNSGGGIYANFLYSTTNSNKGVLGLALINTLIADNKAVTGSGGGIYTNTSNHADSGKIVLTLTNVTLVNNTASTGGGGLHNNATGAAKIDTLVQNTVIWGNGATNIKDNGNDKAVYKNSLVEGLTLDGTGESVNYTSGNNNIDPSGKTSANLFAGFSGKNYRPAGALLNAGNSSWYPDTSSAANAAAYIVNAIYPPTGDAINFTNVKTNLTRILTKYNTTTYCIQNLEAGSIIPRSVDEYLKNTDLGDGSVYDTGANANPRTTGAGAPASSGRFNGAAIDIGAYELD